MRTPYQANYVKLWGKLMMDDYGFDKKYVSKAEDVIKERTKEQNSHERHKLDYEKLFEVKTSSKKVPKKKVIYYGQAEQD